MGVIALAVTQKPRSSQLHWRPGLRLFGGRGLLPHTGLMGQVLQPAENHALIAEGAAEPDPPWKGSQRNFTLSASVGRRTRRTTRDSQRTHPTGAATPFLSQSMGDPDPRPCAGERTRSIHGALEWEPDPSPPENRGFRSPLTAAPGHRRHTIRSHIVAMIFSSTAIGVGSAPTSMVVRVGLGLPGPAKYSA